MTDRLDFLLCEPADVYHQLAKHYLSSHQLADFRKCPQLYYRRKQGLVERVERPAYVIGQAAHTLILEGQDAFEQQFAVGGPINPRTSAPYGANTKAFAEWAMSVGKDVLSQSQFQLVLAMAESVKRHEAAVSLLADGIPEAVVRTDYQGMACQIRMDMFHPDKGIIDLKTCDDLMWFEADARRYGYAHQLAFYRSVLAEVIGKNMPVHLLAVEKREPFRCGAWKVGDDTLTIARQENEAAIGRLKSCQVSDYWPTGYEETRVFDAV